MNVKQRLTYTVIAKDRPGILKALSDVVLHHGGNWSESNFSNLGGQFVGVVLIDVAQAEIQALNEGLLALNAEGIFVTSQEANVNDADRESHFSCVIQVQANDRKGIVEEITGVLAQTGANVDKLHTCCESASMAGYPIFEAIIHVSLPASVSIETLEEGLESVSDDLMVSVKETEN